jgi:hypothetical protein
VDLAPFSARVVFDDSRDASGGDKGERFWILGRDWIGVGGGGGENEKGELVGVHGRQKTVRVDGSRRQDAVGGCDDLWPLPSSGLIQTALTQL